MRSTTFTVYGRPVPQGSMVASYNRKQGVSHVHHVQGAALTQWRAAIRQAAIDADAPKLQGSVQVNAIFGMPRPLHHFRTRHYKPTRDLKEEYRYAYPTSPDVDKLARAVLDALSQVCYYDDAQVTVLVAIRTYRESTEITVREYGKRTFDATKLEEEAITGAEEGQLPLSDLRETLALTL